ncbi:MAG: 1,6-anhydro-N-acetylmuramyl-L-alanine amidase AmpD [Gammaproteobacteria bacterium]|nr:1,6-anhydro-N-acetylmuramyl-L-alanine amidase AmpD [Gammaproteobacteria bacterium]
MFVTNNGRRKISPYFLEAIVIIDKITGRLNVARWRESPNCDERPTGMEPELIVIHNISLPPGEFGSGWIEALFFNRLDPEAHPYFAKIHQLRVSAHLLIHRDGTLTQFVPFHQRAWHAGESCYSGRQRCNDFSIGIELEGTDDQSYEPVQYHKLAGVIEALLLAYPGLCRNAIVGHEHIAPGRKTDPGAAFDWSLLRSVLGV